MNKQLTLEELRNVLLNKISRLMEIEPYWNKCTHCQHNGKCCINANISVREDEWEIIKNYISNMNKTDKTILKHNIVNNILCPFRASDKCIIHDVRPLNCIWTPFQVVQHINNGDIKYFMINDDCDYQSITINHQNFIDNDVDFLQLDSYDKRLYYLFLNDIFINFVQNTKYNYLSISKLINQALSLIC